MTCHLTHVFIFNSCTSKKDIHLLKIVVLIRTRKQLWSGRVGQMPLKTRVILYERKPFCNISCANDRKGDVCQEVEKDPSWQHNSITSSINLRREIQIGSKRSGALKRGPLDRGSRPLSTLPRRPRLTGGEHSFSQCCPIILKCDNPFMYFESF